MPETKQIPIGGFDENQKIPSPATVPNNSIWWILTWAGDSIANIENACCEN